MDKKQDSIKKSCFWIDYFFIYLSLNPVLNYTAAILELFWAPKPKIKWPYLKNYLRYRARTSDVFHLSGRGTIDVTKVRGIF